MKGLKFFREMFSNYEYANIFQTLLLFMFITFFLLTVYTVWKRPKGFYKEAEELPLEDNDKLFRK